MEPRFEHFDAFVDDSLDPEARAALMEALTADPALKSELDQYAESVQLLRSMPVERPPERFFQMVQQRIRRRTRGQHFADQANRSMVIIEAAVCAVLICVMTALYLYGALAVQAPKSAASDVERVHLTPADRRFLAEYGEIQSVSTTVTGSGLEVRLLLDRPREPDLRAALMTHPRIELVTTSVYHTGDQTELMVRVPEGPLSLRSGP